MRENNSVYGKKSAPAQQHGFTLLELVISLGMLSIIIAIVVGAAQLGYRAMESGEKKMDAIERLRTSLRLLNAQVQSNVPLTYDDSEGKQVYFSGTGDSLRFVSAFSLWGGSRGQVQVDYAVETDNGGRRSIRVRETPLSVEKVSETRLFDNLDSCAFTYYFKDETEEEGSWADEWTEPMAVPEKMRITFSRDGNEYALIIPVRAHLPQQVSAGGTPAGQWGRSREFKKAFQK